MFREMNIGTAKPSDEQLRQVRHHFINNLSLNDYYSAAQYESEVLDLISHYGKDHKVMMMVGGSMMYIDAVCKGIDDIPTIDEDTRLAMKEKLHNEGLERMCEELRLLDPEYYSIVDHKNTQRVVHALEICYMTGKTYTSFRRNTNKTRPFTVIKVGLRRQRENLFSRINKRVDQMILDGLLKETEQLINSQSSISNSQSSIPNSPLSLSTQSLPNSLNTVGYKEMINVLKGEWSLDFAVERMKKNTRVYAKKQMTWFQKDQDIHWFDTDDTPIDTLITGIESLF